MTRGTLSILTVVFAATCATQAIAEDAKGYVVGTVTFVNKDWVAEYRPKTAELLDRYGGRILARGKPLEVLEGTALNGDAVLVVEFPSVENARAWYTDPDYAPLRDLRLSGSSADWVLLEGLKD